MTRRVTLGTLLVIPALTLAGCQRPATVPEAGVLTFNRDALVFNAGGLLPNDTRALELRNTGRGPLEATLTVTGEDAARFTADLTGPLRLEAGESRTLNVTFTPDGTLGPQRAALRFDVTHGAAELDEVYLGGLSVEGQEGTREPSLQWIFDTYGFAIDTGDPDPSTSSLTSEVVNAPVGDEVWAQTFRAADPAEPVSVEVIAAFGVPDVEPVFTFGFYDASAAEPPLQTLLSLPITPTLNGQRLEPVIRPEAAATDVEAGRVVRFWAPAGPFGFFSFWPTTRFFDERTVYTEDARNTFRGAAPHHVRTYPLRTRAGETVANAFVLAVDESTRLFDFNDAVLIIRNVQPVAATQAVAE
ncbi:hypothetical protein [Truepera radiovictrix]|uniref:Abnormal spindle-like microcephaly-associated protein ASH domain-containing protein n=1 Tax=Truepera radiovictrix (strain DSM 17093 / CIP 108686 / LMG 22925 / RQ-24) TaxID=649638 RepID=D7CQD9_TRURR|nr:hypothetical protein [Truepera radiovictrix]ADI14923.1 conserved hypothetical protein [Truepera radiovictrix DSM 17093]WMT56526.1 hypothetical protein RCV51_10990 [Truepera radiovictrix]